MCQHVYHRSVTALSERPLGSVLIMCPLESSHVQWKVTTLRLNFLVYCDATKFADDEIRCTNQMQIVDYFWIIKMLHVILKSMKMLRYLLRRREFCF